MKEERLKCKDLTLLSQGALTLGFYINGEQFLSKSLDDPLWLYIGPWSSLRTCHQHSFGMTDFNLHSRSTPKVLSQTFDPWSLVWSQSGKMHWHSLHLGPSAPTAALQLYRSPSMCQILEFCLPGHIEWCCIVLLCHHLPIRWDNTHFPQFIHHWQSCSSKTLE